MCFPPCTLWEVNHAVTAQNPATANDPLHRAMQVTTKPGAAAGGDGAESVRLENAMPVLPPMPTSVRVRARAGLGLRRLECVSCL